MTADFVLAVDFGGTKATVAAADAAGRLLAKARLPMLAERGAEQAVSRTLDIAADMIAAMDGRVCGAGVASPGIVLEDRILLAPNVPGWTELRLGAHFSSQLGVPTVCATDVKAATLAEARWGSLRDVPTGMHLNLGTGPAHRVGPHGGRAPLEEVVGGGAIGVRGRAVGGSGDAASVFRLASTDHGAAALAWDAM